MAHVTIPEQNEEKTFSSYTGTGPLAFTWNWFEESDIRVFLDGSTTPLAAEDYSVTPTTTVVGGYSGGYVTLSESVTSADILLQRSKRGGRETDFATGGAKPQDVNTALDKLTAQYVDLRRDLNRAVVMPPGDNSNILYIGTAAQRAFKVPAFNADGTEIELVDRADIDAIASIANEIANLGTADAINDINTITSGDNLSNIEALVPAVDNMALLGTVAAVADMAALADTGIIADMDALADLESELSALGASNVVEDITLLAGAGVLADMDALADIVSDITGTAAVAGQIATVAADIGLGANSNILNAEQNADNALLYAQQALRDALLCGPYALSDNRYWSSGDDGAPEDMDVTPVTFITNSSDSTWAPLGANGDATQISPRGAWRVIDNRVYRITLDIETSADGTGTPGFRVAWVMMDEDFAEITTINEDVESLAASSGRTVYEWRASTAGISPAENTELTTAGAIWVRPRLLTNPSGTDGDFNVHGFIIEDITPLKDAEQVTSAEGMALGATAGAVFTEDSTVGEALVRLDSEKQDSLEKGQAGGYASLDGSSQVPIAQVPTIPATGVSFNNDTAELPGAPTQMQLAMEAMAAQLSTIYGERTYLSSFSASRDAGTLNDFLKQDISSDAPAIRIIDDDLTITQADMDVLLGNADPGIIFPAGAIIMGIGGSKITFASDLLVPYTFSARGERGSGARFINMHFDANGAKANIVAGSNQNDERLHDYWAIDCTFENLKHDFSLLVSGTEQGGRGFTVQAGATRCGSIGCTYKNVYDPIHLTGKNNIVTHGSQRGYGLYAALNSFENCPQLVSIYNQQDDGEDSVGFVRALIAQNTFENCGRLPVADIPGWLFRRVGGDGNSYPFLDLHELIADGSATASGHNGNWQPQSTFDAGEAEWSAATGSYTAGTSGAGTSTPFDGSGGDLVKVTNTEETLCLINILGDVGATITGLSGGNDNTAGDGITDYGYIKGIIGGTFAGVRASEININVNTRAGVWCGYLEGIWPVTPHADEKCAESYIEFTNRGITDYIVDGNMPDGDYEQLGIHVKATVRRDNLTAALGPNIAGASNSKGNLLDANDFDSPGARLEHFWNTVGPGNFNIPNYADGGYNYSTRPFEVLGHNTGTGFRLRRTGTGAGSVTFGIFGNSALIGDATKLSMSEDGGRFEAKSADGTYYDWGFNNGGDLDLPAGIDLADAATVKINGTTVLDQSGLTIPNNSGTISLKDSGGTARSIGVNTSGQVTISGAPVGGGLAMGAATALEVNSSGVITVTGPGLYTVDWDGGTTNYDVITISGGSDGDVIVLRPLSSSRAITFRDKSSASSDNIVLPLTTGGSGQVVDAGGSGGDMTLANARDRLILQKQGSEWVAWAVSWNQT